jgi:hypothetical protein
LGVEQFDRGVLMGWGIEIGGHPATTKRGQHRTEDLSAFKIAPGMGAGVTDLVEMLEAFEASQKWGPPETAIEGGLVI